MSLSVTSWYWKLEMKEINCVTEDRYIAKVRSTRICGVPVITVKKKNRNSVLYWKLTLYDSGHLFLLVCDSEREEGGISSTNIHSSAPPQWGRQLGSSRGLFPVELLTPLCRSFCSEMARFRLRPLMAPRCHLQMSPFSISWMCCTMRLMATGKRERAYKQTILFV